MTKKRLLIACFIFLFALAGNAQRKRAFMVGISHYDTALTGYQWNNINGAEDVLLLSPILQKQGFSLTTILDEQATCDIITHRLTHFVSKTKRGDIVYIHFSTHGQPVEDINGDEADGWDEAIVPIDAYKIYRKGVYEGKHHLIDDQLNTLFKELRKMIGPNGFLYVVIDACHAGTASRANDETVRGTNVGFTSNKKIFKPSPDKKSHYRIDASAKLSNVMFIEACRADQVNREIKVADKHYGPLSYNIAQTLSEIPLTTDATGFLNRLKITLLKGGNWPNNQNMVIETSY